MSRTSATSFTNCPQVASMSSFLGDESLLNSILASRPATCRAPSQLRRSRAHRGSPQTGSATRAARTGTPPSAGASLRLPCSACASSAPARERPARWGTAWCRSSRLCCADHFIHNMSFIRHVDSLFRSTNFEWPVLNGIDADRSDRRLIGERSPRSSKQVYPCNPAPENALPADLRREVVRQISR